MWCTMFRSWKKDKHELVKALIELEKSAAVEEEIGFTYQQGIFEARVHGNPLVESGQVIWHESTNTIRSQTGTWKLEGIAQYFEMVGDAYAKTEGQFLIDVDDPELLELGEEGVHKRLTDYLAEFCVKAKDDPDWPNDLVDAIVRYTDESFFCRIETGDCTAGPPPLVLEAFRRSRGFPYEWHGAPID